MTNDTPRTTTEPPQERQVRKFRSLGESHIAGSHDEHPYPGCAGCLLSGALDQDGGEGA